MKQSKLFFLILQGMFDQLMDVAFTPEIDFLRLLAFAKLRVNAWFFGPAMRDVPVTFNGSAIMPIITTQAYEFQAVMARAWWLPEDDSLGLFFATPQRGVSANVGVTLDLTRFGFPAATATTVFSVTSMQTNGQDIALPSQTGSLFRWQQTMGPHTVQLLRIAVQSDI
jgi:hypothetical protein